MDNQLTPTERYALARQDLVNIHRNERVESDEANRLLLSGWPFDALRPEYQDVVRRERAALQRMSAALWGLDPADLREEPAPEGTGSESR